MPKLLITGAYGLLGTRLQTLLLERGYTLHTIGRGAAPASKPAAVQHFVWDIDKQQMDTTALAGVDAILHLAGAGVADERWTAARKKEIYDSRIEATRLLHTTLSAIPHQVKTVVSASAVGIYGSCGNELIKEDQPAADTFLARVVKDWEEAVQQIGNRGTRTVCCRIGIVLAANGGALPALTRTVPIGVAGYFAVEPLFYPWIHIDDVCGILIHAVENRTMQGAYNTTAPHPVPIHDLMKAILIAKKSKAILAPVPPIALRIAVGEMADMLLSSQRCSATKILDAGYIYKYETVAQALKAVYN